MNESEEICGQDADALQMLLVSGSLVFEATVLLRGPMLDIRLPAI